MSSKHPTKLKPSSVFCCTHSRRKSLSITFVYKAFMMFFFYFSLLSMWTPRYLYFLTLSTFCPRSDRWPSHFPPFLWSYSHTGLDDFSKTTILFLLLITYSSKHCRIICEFCSKSCHESLKSTS